MLSFGFTNSRTRRLGLRIQAHEIIRARQRWLIECIAVREGRLSGTHGFDGRRVCDPADRWYRRVTGHTLWEESDPEPEPLRVVYTGRIDSAVDIRQYLPLLADMAV